MIMNIKMDKVDLSHPNCQGVVQMFSNANTQQ